MTKKKIWIKAQTRDKKENLNQLRRKGEVPAVLYGPGMDKNVNLKVNLVELHKVYEEAGESSFVDLQIDGGDPIKVLIKDVQLDSAHDNIIHADFYKVDMNKEITTYIPLEFVGESKAVKESGCLLIKNHEEVEVECLPANLVERLEVDLTLLNEPHSFVRFADLQLPAGIKVLHSAEDVIVTAVPKETQKEEPEAEKEEESQEQSDEQDKTSKQE